MSKTESFEAYMSDTESFEAYLFKLRGYCFDSSYATYLCDCLRRAYEREIEQARDPQRIGGRLERGSFEYAIEQLREFRWQHATNDEDAIPYINGVAKAHAQSLKREYHRGFEDGAHSMDAEHRAIAMRLRALPLDGGSHENLSQIARAIYHSDFGWTQGACAALRDELVRLMGGVSDGIAEPITTDELIEYINEDTRRLKADRAMEVSDGNCACAGGGACAAGDGGDSGEQVEVSDGRVADDCGAAVRCGDGCGDLHMDGVRITDELREFKGRINAELAPEMVLALRAEINAIADRIDEQFNRVCEQQEAVLQSTVDGMCEEQDRLQAKLDRANGENKGLRLSVIEQKEAIIHRKKTIKKLARDNEKVWKTVHELQAKLNEYDSTHIELPRDANGEVFHLGCTVRMVERHPEVLLTVHSMTLCDDGMWRLYAWDDKNKYSCNLSTSEFELCEQMPDTAESIVRDLSMGTITESEAINRIEALNG